MTDQNKSASWADEIFGKNPLKEEIPATLPGDLNKSRVSTLTDTLLNNRDQIGIDKSQSENLRRFTTKITCPRLIVYTEKIQGKIFEITAEFLKLGRASSNDIVIPDPCISSKHCVFETKKDGVWIRDLNSANGTFVNGQQVTECLLRCGDVIRCGTSILKFEITIKRPRLRSATESSQSQQITHNSHEQQTQTAEGSSSSRNQGPISFEKLSSAEQKSSAARKSTLLVVLFLAACLLIFLFVKFFLL